MATVDSLSARFDGDSTLSRPGLWLVIILFVLTPFTRLGYIGIEIMAFAIAVVGFDLLIGYTGYVSFGQAMFFGGGAYATNFAVNYFGLSFIPAVLAGILTAGMLAAFVGVLSLQRRGVYFALLTLAFAQMLWTALTVKSDISGGTEGLAFNRPPLELGFATVPIDTNRAMFVVTIVITVLFIIAAVRITQSPFGQVLRAIRENEDRVAFLGYNSYHYKIVAFVIAGLYAGAGGALYTMYTEFSFLSLAFWETSGELLMMVLIGGMGTIFGPIGGVYVFIALRNLLSSAFSSWQLWLGGIFVFVILFSPDGIVGIYHRLRDRLL